MNEDRLAEILRHDRVNIVETGQHGTVIGTCGADTRCACFGPEMRAIGTALGAAAMASVRPMLQPTLSAAPPRGGQRMA